MNFVDIAIEDVVEDISQKEESTKLNLSLEDLELEIKKEVLEGQKQDRVERKDYALKIFWLLVGFLIVTLGMTTASGVGLLGLSDNVLIALLTTTSADVIGIFVFVVKYLFKAS
ncbi:hypothetical protein AGMMS49982_06180 [Bacteroidia bacterium]|nr:hypothetical protein AGMMS49982_06180 [Bacteroidia bacterium]